MKKTKNFLLSLILPRRMAKYRNMHNILVLFIYLIGMFLAIGSQFIMSENFVAKEMERTEYLDSLKGNDDINFADMQVLSFSDKKSIKADESKALKITNKICSENFDNGDKTVKFVYNDTFSTATINEGTTILDYYKSIKGTTQKQIFYIFGNDGIYYVQNLDTSADLPTDENKQTFVNDVFSRFKCLKYDQEGENKKEEFIKPLQFLQRLKKINKVSFVNNMNKILDIPVEVKTLDDITNTNVKTFDEYTKTYFASMGIYHCVLKDNPEGFVDLTVVIDVNMDTDNDHKKFTYFDYEGYLKQDRADNTTYILCVYSSRRFFFVYDLCQKLTDDGSYSKLDYNGNSIFEKTSAGNYQYYLPSNPSEIKYNAFGEIDTRFWTDKVNSDDVIKNKDAFYGATELTNQEIDNIKPVDRHKENLEDAIYTKHSRSYQYRDLNTTGFEESNTLLRRRLNKYLQVVCDAMIAVNAANYELIYGIIAFGIFVIFPLILVLIVWLMSRKLVMKKFRQYYAIGGICYAETGLLAFIVGFFVPFDKFALYLMLVQAWYFIFVTFRINTDPQYNNDGESSNSNQPVEEKLEFKKIKESSNASKIG